MEEKIIKYPRTKHIEGSMIQKGDEDLKLVSLKEILGKNIVIEEKVDGANVAISFNDEGKLLLQNRGHFLRGGYKERDYDLFKSWAEAIKDKLFSVLKNRYIMYGEWMYVKHYVYYDMLPHYFLEFDIYDKKEEIFLDTKSRKELLKDLPIYSVPVLKEGKFNKIEDILSCLKKSNYISENHLNNLYNEAIKQKVDPNDVINKTDNTKLMEGLYIKVEENGQVILRTKYVRTGFSQIASIDDTNWLQRKVIPNKLDKELDELFLEEY